MTAREHLTPAESVVGDRLVVDVQVQRGGGTRGAAASTGRNQVARESAFTATDSSSTLGVAEPSAEGHRRLRGQQPQLTPRRTNRLAGGHRGDRRGTTQEHLARGALECPDPLAHRARREVQAPGRGVEGPLLEDDGQGLELDRVEAHGSVKHGLDEGQLQVLKKIRWPSMRGAPTVTGCSTSPSPAS